MLNTRFLIGYLMNQAGSEPAGGGAPAGGEAKFTQEDVNRIVADRLKKVGDVDALKAQAAKAAEYESELAKLREEAALAGKSEIEKANARYETAERKWKADLETRDKSVAEALDGRKGAEAALRAHVVGSQVNDALLEAKAYVPAMSDARASFLSAVEIETNEANAVEAVTFAGKRYSSLKEAATAFLASKPHFAAATGPGGAGTRPGTAGGRPSKPLHEMTTAELAALASRPRN